MLNRRGTAPNSMEAHKLGAEGRISPLQSPPTGINPENHQPDPWNPFWRVSWLLVTKTTERSSRARMDTESSSCSHQIIKSMGNTISVPYPGLNLNERGPDKPFLPDFSEAAAWSLSIIFPPKRWLETGLKLSSIVGSHSGFWVGDRSADHLKEQRNNPLTQRRIHHLYNPPTEQPPLAASVILELHGCLKHDYECFMRFYDDGTTTYSILGVPVGYIFYYI